MSMGIPRSRGLVTFNSISRARVLLSRLAPVAAGFALGLCAISLSTAAVAGDASVREMQRLLWSLDYGATRLDGVMSADTKSRLQKFLATRGKASLAEPDAIVAELRAAFDELRATTISSKNVVVDRSRLLSSNDSGQRMEVSPTDGLVFTGSCPIYRVRLSDNAPLKPFEDCNKFSSFVLSRALRNIVSYWRWDNRTYGLFLIDEASGLRTDFIEIPGIGLFSKIGINSEGKEALVLAGDSIKEGSLWKVNLETRSIKKISQFPKSLAQGVRFSPDGRFYSASWTIVSGSGKTFKSQGKIGIWNSQTDQKLYELPGEQIVFSDDGNLIAVQDAKDSSTIEIRETSTNRTITRKTFAGNTPSFSFDDNSTAFNSDNTGFLYVDTDDNLSALRRWDFLSGDVKELFKLNSQVERASIQLSQGKLVTIEGTDIVTYALDGSSQKDVSHVKPLEIKGGAVSSNGKTLLAFAADSLALADLDTGRVRSVPTFGATNISAAAFLPDSDALVVGTEDGTVFGIENGKRRDIVKLGDEIKVVVSAGHGVNIAVQSGKKVIVLDASAGRIIAQERCGNCWEITPHSLAFVDNDSRVLFNDTPAQEYQTVALDIASGRRLLNQAMKSNVRKTGNRTTWMRAWIGFVAQNKASPGTYWIGGKSFGSNILYEYSQARLLPKRGSPEGTFSFFAAGSAVGDSFEDGLLVVVLGPNQPKTTFTDRDEFSSVHLALKDDPLLLKTLTGGRFVTLDKSGEVRVYSRSSANPLIRTILYGGDDWLSRTEQGFFAGTKPAAANLFLAQGSSGSVSLDSMFNALYRPELVAEAIQGDPNGKVKAAAALLDLDKVLASGAAPKVAIVSPAAGTTSPVDEVAVEATIADQGGGIGKVEWRVNGLTLGLEARGLDRLGAPAGSNGGAAAGKVQTVKRTLSLEPGDNRIEVLAYNARGLIASEAAQVTVKWDGSKSAAPPKLYVLAVGVNDYYDSRLRLAYAVPDATALAEGFRKAGDGLYAGVEVKTVLDSDVTLSNLDKVFGDLGRKVQPRDVFVFFLAGHGKTKNGRYYFLPRDFRYEDESSIEKAGMGQDKFQAWFASIPARKSLLLYDTCESGSLTGATRGSDVDERLGALNRMARATGRTYLTATTDDAPALEGYRGHGVFTYALLDALDRGDVNRNGLIEISELADYIDQKVPDYSFEAFKLRQIPQRSIVGSNFALTNKAEVLPAGLSSAASSNNSASIPAKPTHVVITQSPVEVFAGAARDGVVVHRLAPGTTVTLIETANGWQLIAKDGQKLGYVEEKALTKLQ